jgi:hypothetical protein
MLDRELRDTDLALISIIKPVTWFVRVVIWFVRISRRARMEAPPSMAGIFPTNTSCSKNVAAL